MLHRREWSATATVPARRPRVADQWSLRAALAAFGQRHREHLWIVVLALLAAVAHGVNMTNFPYYETDEGTYMSQAWAVVRLGELAPYTYWYDHAPAGWFQIAGWSLLTGGFYTFGSSVDSGRVFMLVLQVAATVMVYRITRAAVPSPVGATIAALTFALSAYGIYFHRRVLLDNITTFWMLLSILLLVQGRPTLSRVWLSAAALGLSILSKELTIFLVPVLAYLVYYRVHPAQRLLATAGWVAVVGCLFSLWFLMALLKNELFPSGTWLGGSNAHVSLLETLQFQMSRGKDGGILQADSNFWKNVVIWARDEPLLVLGGSVAAGIAVLAGWRHRLVGILGGVTLSLWFFFARGGLVLGFYLLPLLPLMAINLGTVIGLVATKLRAWQAAGTGPTMLLQRGAAIGMTALCLSGTLLGYASPNLKYGSILTPWQSSQAVAQREAVAWVKRNISPKNSVITDNHMWVDLHVPPSAGADYLYKGVYWHWKVDRDPEIREGVFEGDWGNIDYVMVTAQMMTDVREGHLDLMRDAIEHASPIAYFDTGGWPVEVRRVNKVHQLEAAQNPMLVRSWESYKERFIDDGRVIDPNSNDVTTSEGQSYALLRAVYLNDQAAFDRMWAWTKANLQVREDGLLAWRWGVRPDGTTGVLDMGAATDADQDTALALLFAARRWHSPHYQAEALTILRGIWEHETALVDGQRVVVAGDWARGADGQAVINPSYFAPYAYRIFAEADPERPWNSLVDSTYAVLARIHATPDLGGAAGLVPNWLAIDVQTGALAPAPAFGEDGTNFSFDASRLPWRLTQDWLWFHDTRAKEALASLTLPQRELAQTGNVMAAYRPDGTPAVEYEALSMYAGILGGLLVAGDEATAHRVFAEEVLKQYVEDAHGAHWGDPDNYYDQNWAWFVTALMDGGLSNLWAGKTVIDWEAARAA